MIEFESVGKKFRDGTAAVQDLSLRVPSDQITVVVGPSGCGKTTTLRMVNRMLEPTSGTITWDGTPMKSRRKTTLRRQMGYVIQNGGLFPHRTVLENIGTVPGLLGWDKSKTRKRSFELLDSVGLDTTMANRYPAQLSGGQQQRVGVARALAADPLVLLMDEPFSSVDPVVRSELHEFFLGLQRELSKTIMLITHDIEEAIKLGDQVAIMRFGGRLAQVGTPQQLLDEPDDAFVEGFIGRDRGYRSLSFLPASTLELDGVRVVREAGPGDGEEPTLVVDGDARPVGWVDPKRPGEVYPVGSAFVPENDTLRAALDSALTSPFGLAVAVASGTGRYAGVVGAPAILAQASMARTDVVASISVRAAEVRKDFGAVPDADDVEAGHQPPATATIADGETVGGESAQTETADAETADAESAQTETADAETTDAESAQTETADAETTDAETAHAETADAETADAEPAQTETADAETTDAETTDAEHQLAPVPSGWERPQGAESGAERTGATALGVDDYQPDHEFGERQSGVEDVAGAGFGVDAGGDDESERPTTIRDEPLTADPGASPVPEDGVPDGSGFADHGPNGDRSDAHGSDDAVPDPLGTAR